MKINKRQRSSRFILLIIPLQGSVMAIQRLILTGRRVRPTFDCEQSSSRVLKNSYLMSRATNLECADNGGALDFLAFSSSANPKRRRATLAAALQISF